MLVATFGPSTAWQGREIIWDADHFILVGHGAIPAAGVLDYDRRGQLVWPDPALRSWVFQVDLWENGGRSSLGPGGSLAARPMGVNSTGAQSPGAQGAERARRGIPLWVIVVIVVGAFALVGAIALAVTIPAFLSDTAQTFGQDLIVRTNIQDIKTGIDAYATGHGGEFPTPGEVNSVGLSGYITVWPQNPYTRLPMADGGGEGNFRYDLSPDGGAYKLIGYGRDGSVVIELSGGDQTTV
jgi:hypothetical protein